MAFCQDCKYPVKDGRCTGCHKVYRKRTPLRTYQIKGHKVETRVLPLTRLMLDYLRQRGLSSGEIEDWVRLEGNESYVFLPVNMGFLGRRVVVNRPKYLSVGLTYNEVWRIERVVPQTDVYVCEGVFDAYYFSEVVGVATVGGSVTKTQAENILTRLPSRVILGCDRGVDPDEFGYWFRKLDRRIPIDHALPPGEDWGDEVQAGRRFEI